MSKTWALLVLVNLKYCAEKKFLKTHIAFFIKVTVLEISFKNNTPYSLEYGHLGQNSV
jgi:hypothetical protein